MGIAKCDTQFNKKRDLEYILIDNYIDESTLSLFKKTNTLTIIYTKKSQSIKHDYEKYNQQYKNITIKYSNKFHDRFLIIDDNLYYIGASLKDLGKKCFGFSKMDKELLTKLQKIT